MLTYNFQAPLQRPEQHQSPCQLYNNEATLRIVKKCTAGNFDEKNKPRENIASRVRNKTVIIDLAAVQKHITQLPGFWQLSTTSAINKCAP